jgi:hypothetical protein
MVPRRTHVVGTFTEGKRCFCRYEDSLAGYLPNGFTKDFLGESFRVHIRGIEEINPGVQADSDQPRCFFHIGSTPGLEELVSASERTGAEAENRNL